MEQGPVYSKEEIFEYLVDLRDSGDTNMWGSPAYLIADFGMSKKEAFALVKEWMDSFKKEPTS